MKTFDELSEWLWNHAIRTQVGPEAKRRMQEFDKELSDALDTVWQAGFERGKLEGNK